MVQFFVGEFLFIGLIAAASIAGGGPLDFLDFPSLLIIVGGCFGLTIISFSFKDISNALSQVFGESGGRDELRQAAYFWFTMIRNLLAVGAIGTLIGVIQMLGNLEDASTIGPSMAVALITFFYAIFFSGILPLPAYYIIQRRLANDTAE